MAPLPPLRDGGCALPICPFGRACLPLISDAPDCKCSPGRLRFWVVWASRPGAAAPISIHAPRVGRDFTARRCTASAPEFQSTRPVWGATTASMSIHRRSGHFNPRAPCGARLTYQLVTDSFDRISIHAPRVGRDFNAFSLRLASFNFNPRAPCGARRIPKNIPMTPQRISIHAPRVGRDCIR